MRDFLPEDVRRREYVIGTIKSVYERYGFEPLETPAVENIDTLLGKYGEEGNQLIYKILMRGEHEASGKADLALRYDLTVPLARVIAEHRAKLPRMFKRYQIQPVWRADRPARGRFREFYQCDVDALGSTSPAVEAELCAAVNDALEALGFSDFAIRLNHRGLLTGVLESAGLSHELHAGALISLDKLDKVGAEGVAREFTQRGIDGAASNALLELFAGPPKGFDELASVVSQSAAGRAGVENLRAIVALAGHTSASARLRIDASLARGLSYYTGAIMEINVEDLAGSLGGGGRYDNLVGMFSNESIPACGFSLGLERILVVMGERGMFPATIGTSPADVMVGVLPGEDIGHALRLATLLRTNGLKVMVYPDPAKIDKHIKYADSLRIPFLALLGANEIAAGQVTVRILAERQNVVFAQESAGAEVKRRLGDMRG
jgi:histidyl-tRNA synthetase